MPRPEGETPPLTLYGCWDVWERMGRPDEFEDRIVRMETEAVSNPSVTFDVAKSLIESTCRTILVERRSEYDEKWDIPKLVRETVLSVNIAPEGFAPELTDAVRRLAGGLSSAAQCVGVIRNKGGSIGHGPPAHTRMLDPLHGLFVARAADSLVHILYMAHVEYPSPEIEPEFRMEDNADFNDYVDAEYDAIELFDVTYPASEVLYRVDEDAYRNYLAEFEAEAAIDAFLYDPLRGEAAARENAAIEDALLQRQIDAGDVPPGPGDSHPAPPYLR